MRVTFISFFLLVSFVAPAQNVEFEGIIKYQHKYIFHTKYIDTSEVISAFGLSSVFHYKNGNYKWIIISDKKKNVEYFDDKTQTVYSLYEGNDTLLKGYKNGYDDSLAIFTIDNNVKLVNGLKCKVATTVSFTKDDSELECKRILYFNPAVSIGKNRFIGYRTYGSNKVLGNIKCWPVKIILEFKSMPVTYILEAVEIIPSKLNDSEVILPENHPVKPRFNL